MQGDPAPAIATVERNGVVESAHRGAVAVADPSGALLAGLGTPDADVYVRSAAKPFQALAILERLADAGESVDDVALAIACASHVGSDDHQIEAARLLALAGLDESALRCPPGLPAHLPTLLDQREPTRLAHNCSGKHAAFLLAHTATGGTPEGYLHLNAPLQRRIRDHLEMSLGGGVTGPGVDGCGAPAWRVPLRGLAAGFAALAAARAGVLGRIRAAMQARPDLVAGVGVVDTELMRGDARVVAKRGAEGVLAAGFARAGQPAGGVAVTVEDGGDRAAGPVVAALLHALGASVRDELLRRPVLGGGERHGDLAATPSVARLVAGAGQAVRPPA